MPPIRSKHALAATVAGLSVFVAPGAAQSAPASSARLAPIDDVRNEIVRLAASQVGVREGANNCNPYGPCEAWCADFAKWTWDNAGANTAGVNAAAVSFAQYGQRNGTWHAEPDLKNARPGDAVLYNLGDAAGGGNDHVGIFAGWVDGQPMVISGNYSDGVFKHRAWDAGAVSGFTSPKPR